ncbi:MAG: ABC transporter substrate-binding protein/permease [Candidatus Kapabacteria bacterium]|nr:ABC transporter substrate-binding protein/permease [Candidatus Kapabacteria bacterium]
MKKEIPNIIIATIAILLLSIISSFSQKPAELRWAADLGPPFVFMDKDNPDRIIGFEMDIVTAIAREMGRTAVLVQNAWDGLIPGFNRNDYDIIVNGMEITNDRMKVVNFSDPYYITYEQVIVRKDQQGIEYFENLIGKKVGTLNNSYAEKIMNVKGGINVKSYESESNALEDLRLKRIDAVLIDAPVAIYYLKGDSSLKFSGGPIGQISYGIAIRKKDTLLLKEVNAALTRMSQRGDLKRILSSWGMWNDYMEKRYNVNKPSESVKDTHEISDNSRKTDSLTFQWYLKILPKFLEGAMITLGLSILSMILAIILGLIIALLRVYGGPFLSRIAIIYIEVIRGTPLLMQLFLIYYALPKVTGISIEPFLAAILGLGLNYAAYEAENYRAGLFSVPKGQMEAALSLGMRRRQALRYIIIPQAIRLVIPPMTNDFISLLKDSSLVSVITMVELTKIYNQVAATSFDYFGTGLIVAAIYLLLGLPFVRLSKYAEKKFSVEKKKFSI